MKTYTLKIEGCWHCPLRHESPERGATINYCEGSSPNETFVIEKEYYDSFPEKCPLKEMNIIISASL